MLFTYSKCPICGFISSDPSLSNIDMPCPHCKKPPVWKGPEESRIMFPHFFATNILSMIEYFYKNSKKLKKEQINELLMEVEEISQKALTEKAIDEFYEQFASIDEKRFDDYTKYWDMVHIVQSNIKLDDEKALELVITILSKYPPRTNEAKSVVILFCIFFETIFTNFLIDFLRRQGLAYKIAENTVKEIRLLDRQIKYFENITGEENIFKSEFSLRVREIRKKRNKFIHTGNEFCITEKDADISYELSRESVNVFADLYNKFCLKKINE